MKEQIEKRLRELKEEFESGQKMLDGLAAKEAELRQTLLRIAGAVQVLEEELAREGEASAPEGKTVDSKGSKKEKGP
ncbi:MAG: hypothetical protein GY849_13115 [Deltaproteobacteria bacterium]|nr:hypothetical protein [Deltaproteobacteria bacterium]